MRKATVTITCPACGGAVEGVEQTDEEQTVRCRFCRTELHVPRIGAVVHERVVREVVREAPPQQIVIVDGGAARRARSVRQQWIMVAVTLCFMGPLILFMRCRSENMHDDFEKEQQKQDACEARCKTQCAHAGDKEDANGFPPDVTQMMKHGDVVLCESHCEMDSNCVGLPPDVLRRTKP